MTKPHVTVGPSRVSVKLATDDLAALLRVGERVFDCTVEHGAHRVEVRMSLAEDLAGVPRRIHLADAITRDLPHRYERGWNLEERRYEHGTTEWIAMVVSNADRIDVGNGRMLADLDEGEQRAWLRATMEGKEEVRIVRKIRSLR